MNKGYNRKDVLYRMFNVIDSCVNEDQLFVAMDYCRLFYKRNPYKDIIFFENFLTDLFYKKLKSFY